MLTEQRKNCLSNPKTAFMSAHTSSGSIEIEKSNTVTNCKKKVKSNVLYCF